MFRKLAPQKVQHSDGYVVQVADRTHVEYIDGVKRAVVEVEFAPIVGVYRSTLEIFNEARTTSDVVLGRIVAGLEAMGCEVELY
jgi:hypothetical protein